MKRAFARIIAIVFVLPIMAVGFLVGLTWASLRGGLDVAGEFIEWCKKNA